MNREKFEDYAISAGMRCYEANCQCCTYFDEDTEIAWQAWNAAIESVATQHEPIKTDEQD